MQWKMWVGLALLALTACNKDVEFVGSSLDSLRPRVIADEEFAVGAIATSEVRFRPRFGLVEEVLSLREMPPVVRTLRQVERRVRVDEYKQGHDGDRAEREFEVSKAGKLDLLIVVDNSGSMKEEQENLSGKLKDLTVHLGAVDWQIGVVTTDNCNLRNESNPGMPIRKDDPTAPNDFLKAIEAGIKGSGNERGLLRARQALSTCGNKANDWLRSDSSIAVFFVTDENNYRSGGVKPDDFIKFFRELRPDEPEKLRAYGLIWTKDECKTGGSEGKDYLTVIDEIGGLAKPICADDYTPSLTQISEDVARKVKHEFELPHDPIAGSLTVEIDGQPYTDFSVTGRTLKLNNAKGSHKKMHVVYRHDATPKFERVKLAERAAAATINVWVDNDAIDPSMVSYDEANQDLFFTDMPPDNAVVKVKYRVDERLPREFDLNSITRGGTVIGVSMNGQALSNWHIDPVIEVVSFDEPPVDGAELAFSVRVPGSEITRYAIGAKQTLADVMEVSVFDAASGDPVDAVLEGEELVFHADDVQDGRRVIVSYNYGDESTVLMHELPHDPLAGTVQIAELGSEACVMDVAVEGRTVSFHCNGESLGEVAISYAYVAAHHTRFKLEGKVPDDARLQVFVDGAAVSGWTREGQSILVPAELTTPDSKVRVIATVYERGA